MLRYLHLYPWRWLAYNPCFCSHLMWEMGTVEAHDLLPVPIPWEAVSNSDRRYAFPLHRRALVSPPALSKLPNPFWRGAARLIHSTFARGFVCCNIFNLWKHRSPCLAHDSILPFFCNRKSPWSSYVCILTNFRGRNKGKPLVKHNPSPPKTPKGLHIRHQDTSCRQQPGRAQGGLDPALHRARGDSSS